MKTYIIGILIVLLASIALALTPQQRMEQRRLEAEEYRKQLTEGQRRPSRFAEKQKRPGDIGYMPPTGRLIAVAVDDRYCYVLDGNGRLSKIAKANIKENKEQRFMADYK